MDRSGVEQQRMDQQDVSEEAAEVVLGAATETATEATKITLTEGE